MVPKIFLVFPAADLEHSKRFYRALGYTVSDPCGDGRAACVVLSKDTCLILQARERFATLTAKEIVDAERSVEAIVAVALGERARVDELADLALVAGGRPTGGRVERSDLYSRGFQDPDGHHFAAVYASARAMDVAVAADLHGTNRD